MTCCRQREFLRAPCIEKSLRGCCLVPNTMLRLLAVFLLLQPTTTQLREGLDAQQAQLSSRSGGSIEIRYCMS